MAGRGAIRAWMLLLPALTMMAGAACAGDVQQGDDAPTGHWINPRRTVQVATGNCRGDLCGWVIWASPEAIADAQDAGVKDLLGTELLRSYHSTGKGRWQGEVYVPDMGRTFSSTMVQLDANRLKISGCILGGWLCKSQIWQRS